MKWQKIKDELGEKANYLVFDAYDRYEANGFKVALATKKESRTKDLYAILECPKKGKVAVEVLVRDGDLIELLKWGHRELDRRIKGELF